MRDGQYSRKIWTDHLGGALLHQNVIQINAPLLLLLVTTSKNWRFVQQSEVCSPVSSEYVFNRGGFPRGTMTYRSYEVLLTSPNKSLKYGFILSRIAIHRTKMHLLLKVEVAEIQSTGKRFLAVGQHFFKDSIQLQILTTRLSPDTVCILDQCQSEIMAWNGKCAQLCDSKEIACSPPGESGWLDSEKELPFKLGVFHHFQSK